MLIRVLILFHVTLFIPRAWGTLSEHVGQLQKLCPDVPALMIKKSALELRVNHSCGEEFTKQLLKKCPDINCDFVVQSFKKNLESRSGSVLGLLMR